MNAEQPPPKTGEGDIMAALEARVRARREKGLATYGTTLQAFNGRRALVDALEEAIDLAAYLEQEVAERAKLEARVATLEARSGWAYAALKTVELGGLMSPGVLAAVRTAIDALLPAEKAP